MPRIPSNLTCRPFTLQEARAAGLTLTSLQGKSWRRLGRGLYCWRSWREDPWQLLAAWRKLLPPDAAFAGLSAAWLHHLDFELHHPVEVVVPLKSGARSRRGLVVRHGDVRDSVEVRGLRTTSIDCTLQDLCRTLPAVEALVLLDAAVRAGVRIHTPLGMLAGPAESPMETRLRWLLLQAGLPRPQVQTDLRDSDGRFVGRADLYYPTARLVIEYDGQNHRDRLVEDNRRQNLILNAGFRLLRFTAADIRQRPDVVTSQVRRALSPA